MKWAPSKNSFYKIKLQISTLPTVIITCVHKWVDNNVFASTRLSLNKLNYMLTNLEDLRGSSFEPTAREVLSPRSNRITALHYIQCYQTLKLSIVLYCMFFVYWILKILKTKRGFTSDICKIILCPDSFNIKLCEMDGFKCYI